MKKVESPMQKVAKRSRFVLVLIAAALLGNAPRLEAQPPTIVTAGQGFVAAKDGDYRFFQYDKTKLQELYLKEAFARSEEDKKYFLAAVKGIEDGFENFMKSCVFAEAKGTEPAGLQTMSEDSVSREIYVPLADFYKAQRRYRAQKIALENRIKSLSLIAGSLPSQVKIDAEGSGLKDAPNYGNIDFTPMVKFYLGRIDETHKFLSDLQQNIQMPTKLGGKNIEKIYPPNKGTSLSIRPTELIVSTDTLRKWNRQIEDAHKWDEKQEDLVKDFLRTTKELTFTFIDKWYQKWRNVREDEEKDRLKDAEYIAEAFFLRSYLRMKYGFPLFAIGIKYREQPFRLDEIFARTKMQFHQEPITEEKETMKQVLYYKHALRLQGERSEKIMDGNLGIVKSGRNLLTWLAGNRNLAVAQKMMLELLAADLAEDAEIYKANGLARLKEMFRQRYLSTDEDFAYYDAKRKDYDPRKDERGSGTSVGWADGSINGSFQKMRKELGLKQTELDLVKEVEEQYDLATGNSRSEKEADSRVDDVFKK